MSTLVSARFVEAWRRHAGLGEALPTLIEAHRADLDRINGQARDAAQATERARRGRAEHVAEGRGGKMPTVPEPIDFDNARRLAGAAFLRQMRALGDDLVAELADAHARILAEAEPLVPLIGSLESDAQAFDRHTSGTARESWARLAVLWRDRKELVSLLGELRLAEVVPDASLPAEQTALSRFRLFAHPHAGSSGSGRVSIVAGRKNTPDALLMARLVQRARDTRPGIYTLNEARAHLAEWQRAEVDEARARRAELLRPKHGAVRSVAI